MTKLRIALMMASTAALLAADNGYNLFQQGLAKERADADPRAAICFYERVVADKSTDRKLAAQALLRTAESYGWRERGSQIWVLENFLTASK